MKTEYDVTKPAEYLRWEEHGQEVHLFGKPYVWVIETGRLRLITPGMLPQIRMPGRVYGVMETFCPGHETSEPYGVCSSCLADEEHDGR